MAESPTASNYLSLGFPQAWKKVKNKFRNTFKRSKNASAMLNGLKIEHLEKEMSNLQKQLESKKANLGSNNLNANAKEALSGNVANIEGAIDTRMNELKARKNDRNAAVEAAKLKKLDGKVTSFKNTIRKLFTRKVNKSAARANVMNKASRALNSLTDMGGISNSLIKITKAIEDCCESDDRSVAPSNLGNNNGSNGGPGGNNGGNRNAGERINNFGQNVGSLFENARKAPSGAFYPVRPGGYGEHNYESGGYGGHNYGPGGYGGHNYGTDGYGGHNYGPGGYGGHNYGPGGYGEPGDRAGNGELSEKLDHDPATEFVIQGEGMGIRWRKLVQTEIYKVAFGDKRIIFDTERKYKKPDLVIRSTHEWYKGGGTKAENNKARFNSGNTTYKSLDPFFEYDCPYVSWSGEPLRNHIKADRLPLLEFNTYKKTNETSKPTSNPHDPQLFKDTIWWGNRLYYFDNRTQTRWIPYLLWTLPELNFSSPNFRKGEENPKEADFVYIASNCAQVIRESLFTKIFDTYQAEGKGVEKVHRYGLCPVKRDDIPRQKSPEGISYWIDNWKIYNKYKFTFAIENSLNPGYVTEKIALAFMANSVPIYYGPPDVFEFFNREAFYYLNEKFTNPLNPTDAEIDTVATELKRLAEDESETTGWRKYLSKPVFPNGIVNPSLQFSENTPSPEITRLGRELRQLYDTEIRDGPRKFTNGKRTLAEILEELKRLFQEIMVGGGRYKVQRGGEVTYTTTDFNKLEEAAMQNLNEEVKVSLFESTIPIDTLESEILKEFQRFIQSYTTRDSKEKKMIDEFKKGLGLLLDKKQKEVEELDKHDNLPEILAKNVSPAGLFGNNNFANEPVNRSGNNEARVNNANGAYNAAYAQGEAKKAEKAAANAAAKRQKAQENLNRLEAEEAAAAAENAKMNRTINALFKNNPNNAYMAAYTEGEKKKAQNAENAAAAKRRKAQENLNKLEAEEAEAVPNLKLTGTQPKSPANIALEEAARGLSLNNLTPDERQRYNAMRNLNESISESNALGMLQKNRNMGRNKPFEFKTPGGKASAAALNKIAKSRGKKKSRKSNRKTRKA